MTLRIAPLLSLCFLLLLAGQDLTAQDKRKTKAEKEAQRQQDITRMVEARMYVMGVQNAYGNGGRMLNISPGYYISVSPDSVLCDLPYLGQSQGATAYGTQRSGAVRMDCGNFSYEQTIGKKGSWEIVIKPREAQDIRSITLSITDDGMVSANVNFQSRSPMRYAGDLVTVF